MLGILNPERALHRSRSEILISPVSPRYPRSAAAESPRRRYRRSSLPGALSLTEAYNVMAVDVSFLTFFFCVVLSFHYHTILTVLFFPSSVMLFSPPST